ncbi:ImmA/IrrE family metallo-endopeptidase [uncultured Streptococcus sp.]|uniref:ImmA/IrrE family metallo-endopeptidase n=1 Tax=uncultured Streptococcus sp. TaxID=83427 RepID=UPI00259A63FD|nr:ImmA/IrrE family metallo-endopeptidase [uncultured Streptococcus sp.]
MKLGLSTNNYSKLYYKTSAIAHAEIYNFMKSNLISADEYTFQPYFNSIVEKYNIKVFEHHFENNIILGTTTNDKRGISISYERDSVPVQQNFTKCHELGHLILEHQGENFTLLPKCDTEQEQEANLFSAFVLIPNIVLYHKIVNQEKNFTTIKNELQLSEIALKYRLINFLQIESNLSKTTAEKYEYEYRVDNNSKNLIAILTKHKEAIFSVYRQAKVDTYLKTKSLISKYNFITNIEVPELSDNSLQIKLSQENNIKTWSYYNKGKTLWYAWDTTEITDTEALQKAKLIHLLKLF